jgi:putative transposase
VDVGVKTAAVVATAAGTLVATLEASGALRDALSHLGHLQRALSRTQKGSANRAKPRRRLGRAHARVGAVRTSRLHQFTAKLATSHGVVVVEDIATANLIRNHHLALAIDRDTNAAADLAAWGEQQQVDRQHQPGCWLPGRGPPPGRAVSSAC